MNYYFEQGKQQMINSNFKLHYFMNYCCLKIRMACRHHFVNKILFNIDCIHHKYHTNCNFNQNLCNFHKHYLKDPNKTRYHIKNNIVLNHHSSRIQIFIIHKTKFHFQQTNFPMSNFAINFKKFSLLCLYFKKINL